MSRRLDLLIERARRVLEEKQEVEVEPASEIHVFDFDQTLHHDYKPSPHRDRDWETQRT